jgi:hypothetical protein
MSSSLYRRVLGQRFAALPRRVRELHDIEAASVWAGRANVERGRARLSRLAAFIAGLPPAGRDQPLCVTFEPLGTREIWTRRFGEASFRSVQFARQGFLCERVGPTTFVFTPAPTTGGLELVLQGVRVLGLPLPRPFAPSVQSSEWEREGVYHFKVEVRAPLAGLIIRYDGWLTRQG